MKKWTIPIVVLICNTAFGQQIRATNVDTCMVNTVAYVGGACASAWGGGDIGAQILAAYAACPAGRTTGKGCEIHVIPGFYKYSTAIVLNNTTSKSVTLVCPRGAGTIGSGQFGLVTLNYTPTTGTAITFAHGAAGGGIDGCVLTGPASGAATGLAFGGAVYSARFTDVDISGFSVGLSWSTGPTTVAFLTSYIHDNATNLSLSGGESVFFWGGSIYMKPNTWSTSCISISGVPLTSISFVGGSIDQCGVTISYRGTFATSISFQREHFENPNGSRGVGDWITVTGSGSNGKVSLVDCELLDDNPTTATEAFLVSNQTHFQILGGWYQSNVSRVSQLINASNSADIEIYGPYIHRNFTNSVNATFTGPMAIFAPGSGNGTSALSGNLILGCSPAASGCLAFQPRRGAAISGITGNLLNMSNTQTAVIEAIDTSGDLGVLGTVAGASFTASGSAATLSGTGACASRASQSGGATAGQVQCTGTTGASTLTIATGSTAPHGWSCWANDITHTLAGSQSTASATAPAISFTSVTTNDVLTFGCLAY